MKKSLFSRLAAAAATAGMALSSATFVAACGDDDDAATVDAAVPAAEASADGGLDAAESGSSVSYRGCPGQFSGLCADLEVPLDYTQPGGKKITVFVDKISTTPGAKKVLWLLQGGPGGTAADMVQLGRQLALERDDLDVYTLEHRGVGFSGRLGCTSADAARTDAGTAADAAAADADTEIAPCIRELKSKYGADLAQYTVSNAARDLKEVIDRTRRPDQEVFVYGVSYGTYWAHRYLQIFPDHAAGVVLDSIVPAEGEALSRFDLHGDLAGQKLAELCKADPTCSARLGADPWARLKSIKALIGTGHCPEAGLTGENRTFLFPYLQSWGLDMYPLAALWRFERCSPEDVTALQHLAAQATRLSGWGSLASQMLYYNVGYSELWESPAPSAEAQRQRYDDAVFAAGQAFDVSHALWPTYPHDEYWGKYAITQTPVLMLNGTLDVQTPIESAIRIKDHLAGAHQTFVTIPGANHGTIGQSPTRALPGQPAGTFGTSCGYLMILGFLTDPRAPIDTSCLADLAPLPWSGIAGVNTELLGTPDIWLGIPSRPATRTPWHPLPPRF